jgi:hypothetical protein
MTQVVSQKAIENGRTYNEAEVRYHIIDPIIRHLGYGELQDTYLELEQKLSYPYVHVGRRSKKDLPVGFPDFRAGLVGARGSFVVEAKAGSVEITSLEIEQAHSYAAHAQVGANYFLLCNGYDIQIFETLSGPNSKPIVQVSIDEVNIRLHEIENVLSPESLRKHCTVTYDSRLRLSKELSSTETIRSGTYDITFFEYRLFLNNEDCTDVLRASFPQLQQMDQQLELIKSSFELRVVSGVVARDGDGRICADARFAGVTIHNTAAMQLMGIDELSFVTSDRFISHDANSPTMFEGTKPFAVSEGALIPELFGGSYMLEANVVGEMQVRAAMFVNDRKVLGQYLGLTDYYFAIPGGGALKMELDFVGNLMLELDR